VVPEDQLILTVTSRVGDLWRARWYLWLHGPQVTGLIVVLAFLGPLLALVLKQTDLDGLLWGACSGSAGRHLGYPTGSSFGTPPSPCDSERREIIRDSGVGMITSHRVVAIASIVSGVSAKNARGKPLQLRNRFQCWGHIGSTNSRYRHGCSSFHSEHRLGVTWRPDVVRRVLL
jgi:hypothetical protein